MLRKWMLTTLLLISGYTFAAESIAIFAGGCFWCVEADFDKMPGVVKTTSGFDGGKALNPTYKKVSSGKTQYAESVKVVYNPQIVSYEQLLAYFWRHIDPTVKDRQFCDHGKQYRSAIFYLNDAQKTLALESKKNIEQKFGQVYTEVLPSTTFYPAEEYHQNYYQKNPLRYKFYRYRCGRDQRLDEVWGNEAH